MYKFFKNIICPTILILLLCFDIDESGWNQITKDICQIVTEILFTVTGVALETAFNHNKENNQHTLNMISGDGKKEQNSPGSDSDESIQNSKELLHNSLSEEENPFLDNNKALEHTKNALSAVQSAEKITVGTAAVYMGLNPSAIPHIGVLATGILTVEDIIERNLKESEKTLTKIIEEEKVELAKNEESKDEQK